MRLVATVAMVGALVDTAGRLREHFKTLCYGVRAASRKEEISGWYGPFCATRSPAPILRLRVLKCSLNADVVLELFETSLILVGEVVD